MKWFNNLPRLVQFILLLIPVVNWFVEIIVRWGNFAQKPGLVKFILAILATISCGILGWIDLIWVLLFKHLICAK